MNGREITLVLTADPHASRYFRGVFPKDQLPRHISGKPACYVINTDSSRGPGEHWVAVWLHHDGRSEYFDSFGLPPRHREIIDFLRRNSVTWYHHNRRLLQNVTSSTCGLYVIYYICMKSRGWSMRRLLRPFHPHRQRANDELVWKITRPHLSALTYENRRCRV